MFKKIFRKFEDIELSWTITVISIIVVICFIVFSSYHKEERAAKVVSCVEKTDVFMYAQRGRDRVVESADMADYVIRNGKIVEVADLCNSKY